VPTAADAFASREDGPHSEVGSGPYQSMPLDLHPRAWLLCVALMNTYHSRPVFIGRQNPGLRSGDGFQEDSLTPLPATQPYSCP